VNAIIGTYECKADVKGRLILPSPLKKQLIAVLNDGFVLKRSVFDTSLELWPMAEWNVMLKKISKLNTINNKNNDFIKKFLAGVKIIEIDDLGRLLIPKDLLAFSKISKDVVFAGKLNIIEIWDKDVYEKAIDFDENDFAKLAEEVMNTVTDDE
jgi:MraZ protein